MTLGDLLCDLRAGVCPVGEIIEFAGQHFIIDTDQVLYLEDGGEYRKVGDLLPVTVGEQAAPHKKVPHKVDLAVLLFGAEVLGDT